MSFLKTAYNRVCFLSHFANLCLLTSVFRLTVYNLEDNGWSINACWIKCHPYLWFYAHRCFLCAMFNKQGLTKYISNYLFIFVMGIFCFPTVPFPPSFVCSGFIMLLINHKIFLWLLKNIYKYKKLGLKILEFDYTLKISKFNFTKFDQIHFGWKSTFLIYFYFYI